MQPYGNNATIGGPSTLYTMFSVTRPAGKKVIAVQSARKLAAKAQRGPFDEMTGPAGVLPKYEGMRRWLAGTSPTTLEQKRRGAELLFRRIGITFAVHSQGRDPERLIPFDFIPRFLDAAEWDLLSRSLASGYAP
jgi:uncharacterized circularly permuted ATP-grasp superfamily protein